MLPNVVQNPLLLVFLLGLCCLLQPLAKMALIRPLHSELVVRFEGFQLRSNLNQLNGRLLTDNRQVRALDLGGISQLLGCRITSLKQVEQG